MQADIFSQIFQNRSVSHLLFKKKSLAIKSSADLRTYYLLLHTRAEADYLICVLSVTNGYNESLLYSPEEPKMFFSIREPISNRVFSSSRQRGFASK